MAKGSSKGAIGSLFTQNNLIKMGATVGLGLLVLAKINDSKKDEWFYKLGQWTGLKPKTP